MSKEAFINIYKREIRREGADALLKYLCESDFFTAPASTRFHGSYEGGLCEHSINVYHRLKALAPYTSDESCAICALLHDICKTRFYTVSTRNVKVDGQWKQVPYYAVDDKFPYGHGEKSVFMIERFMRLTTEEAMAIRWHMGGFDDNKNCGQAFDMCPLALHLHIADLMATYIDEKEKKDVC